MCAWGSLIERGVREQVDRRHGRPVARNEALAEVSNEVLVGRLRSLPRDGAEAVLQLLLHLEPREAGENARHGSLRNPVREESGVVDAGSDGADPAVAS